MKKKGHNSIKSSELRQQAFAMYYGKKMTQAQIARILKCNQTLVSYMLKKRTKELLTIKKAGDKALNTEGEIMTVQNNTKPDTCQIASCSNCPVGHYTGGNLDCGVCDLPQSFLDEQEMLLAEDHRNRGE
jgi:transposase-like protein